MSRAPEPPRAPATPPVSDLPARFRASLERARAAPRGSRLLVAVSGRSDSVALLHLLHGVARDLGLHLTVTHIQEGTESDRAADAAFVRDLARTLRLSCDIRSTAPLPTDPVVRARVRTELLERTRSQLRAAAVATGETADDVAEALLELLVRGTFPPTALAAEDARPAPRLARPLLPFTHAECLAFLQSRNLPFRPDPDSLALSSVHQRLRLLVLPLLRHVHPDALHNLAASARWWGEETALATDIARAVRSEVAWEDAPGRVTVSHPRWAALPPALRRHLLLAAVHHAAPDAALTRSDLLDLDAHGRTLAAGSTATVGPLLVARTDGTLAFTHAPASPPPSDG